MALIVLGAIVTDIAGSIGGTTFRRGTTYKSAYNKSSGPAFNKVKPNRVLPVLTNIIRGWGSLTQSVQNQWDAQATIYQFPDRFGNLRNITGRQLYIKLTSQALTAGYTTPPDPFNLTGIVPAPSELGVTVVANASGSVISANLEYGANATTLSKAVIWDVRFAGQGSYVFDLARFAKIASVIRVGSETNGNIGFQPFFVSRYGGARIGQRINSAMYMVTPEGFKSNVITDTTVVSS